MKCPEKIIFCELIQVDIRKEVLNLFLSFASCLCSNIEFDPCCVQLGWYHPGALAGPGPAKI
jgi:hypothetical protein